MEASRRSRTGDLHALPKALVKAAFLIGAAYHVAAQPWPDLKSFDANSLS
jgi:hypothetical protein